VEFILEIYLPSLRKIPSNYVTKGREKRTAGHCRLELATVWLLPNGDNPRRPFPQQEIKEITHANHSKLNLAARPIKPTPEPWRWQLHDVRRSTPAPHADWTKGLPVGDDAERYAWRLTILVAATRLQVWTPMRGEVTVPDSTILSYYEEWTATYPTIPPPIKVASRLDV